MFKKLNLLITVLAVSNIALLVLLFRYIECGHDYNAEMVVMSQYAAALEALNDFNSNKLRLYELREGTEREFTHRYDGVFEIWYMPRYPITGKAPNKSIEVFVEMYNTKMRKLYSKKEQEQND